MRKAEYDTTHNRLRTKLKVCINEQIAPYIYIYIIYIIYIYIHSKSYICQIKEETGNSPIIKWEIQKKPKLYK